MHTPAPCLRNRGRRCRAKAAAPLLLRIWQLQPHPVTVEARGAQRRMKFQQCRRTVCRPAKHGVTSATAIRQQPHVAESCMPASGVVTADARARRQVKAWYMECRVDARLRQGVARCCRAGDSEHVAVRRLSRRYATCAREKALPSPEIAAYSPRRRSKSSRTARGGRLPAQEDVVC